MTWWPRASSPAAALYGPARTTMEMCSRILWLRWGDGVGVGRGGGLLLMLLVVVVVVMG